MQLRKNFWDVSKVCLDKNQVGLKMRVLEKLVEYRDCLIVPLFEFTKCFFDCL